MKMEDIRNFFPNHFKRKYSFTPSLNFKLSWNNTTPIVETFNINDRDNSYIESKMNKEPWGKNNNLTLRVSFSKRKLYQVNQTRKTIVSFLKSNLQKAIRRCNNNVALATTKLLLRLDPNELLRRLPIILIEDVGIHKCIIPLIIFMIICSKGYELEVREMDYILGAVNWMCNWDKQIVPEKRDKILYEDIIDQTIWDRLDNDKKNAFLSLYIRINYGGMTGDMKMIRFWMEYILLEDCEFWTSDIMPISYEKCHNFVFQTHVLDCAIDFHIDKYLIDNIMKSQNIIGNEDYENIKNAIWFCMSSLNYRKGSYKPYFSNHLETFEKIKPSLYFFQKQKKHYIEKVFNMMNEANIDNNLPN